MSGIRHVDNLLPIAGSCFQKGDQPLRALLQGFTELSTYGNQVAMVVRQELIKGPETRQGLEFYRHLLATGLGKPTRSPEPCSVTYSGQPTYLCGHRSTQA